jgi:hypothetical protein
MNENNIGALNCVFCESKTQKRDFRVRSGKVDDCDLLKLCVLFHNQQNAFSHNYFQCLTT